MTGCMRCGETDSSKRGGRCQNVGGSSHDWAEARKSEAMIEMNPNPPGLPFRTRVSNALVPLRNWWSGAFGRRRAFIEGRDIAIDNAAMTAYDMGRPDIRDAINRLVERGR